MCHSLPQHLIKRIQCRTCRWNAFHINTNEPFRLVEWFVNIIFGYKFNHKRLIYRITNNNTKNVCSFFSSFESYKSVCFRITAIRNGLHFMYVWTVSCFQWKKKLTLLQELLIETLSNGRKSLFVCVFNLFEKIVANTFLSAWSVVSVQFYFSSWINI